MIVRLKHVKRVRSKGRTYWYHRITGERLPGDHEERAARVLEINSTTKSQACRTAMGSLADIITQYKKAPEFKDLRERTRRDYTALLELLLDTWGAHPVASIERKHVLGLRDKHAETPPKTNKLIAVLRIVIAFAIERGYRTDNPAKDIKRLKVGAGHATWPDDAVDRFLASAPPMMALALKLGLYTGQREGDVLAMSWHDIDGDLIHVVQAKTGTKLAIPLHSALRMALDAQQRVSPIILTTTGGLPFTGSYFRHQWRKALRDAGLQGLVFHGLRYTAAARLAEAGCSIKEIAAITGHKSLGMIEKYSRDADQKRLAGAAILRLENAGRMQSGKLRSRVEN